MPVRGASPLSVLTRDYPRAARVTFEGAVRSSLRSSASIASRGWLGRSTGHSPEKTHSARRRQHEGVHRILRSLRLQAPGRQFGGDAEGTVSRHRRGAEELGRRPLRGGRRRSTRLLEGRDGTPSDARGGDRGNRRVTGCQWPPCRPALFTNLSGRRAWRGPGDLSGAARTGRRRFERPGGGGAVHRPAYPDRSGD